MDWRVHIHQDPSVLGGKPCIRGTRISVELLVRDMADGASQDDILEAYPFLTREQVHAALAFAAASLSAERVIFAEPTGA
ncbi:MAG: DUF433 domain-containing protein [Candidatus Sumerlaeia bacterium]|nr:DUF433 domain-containing protein [Candidatus Sumerlaeia bacterium]